MPVIKQKRIFRVDLKANPDVLYLFGDNDKRFGMGGQAGEMRGEPNACGVRTKWRPDMLSNSFFTDEIFEKVRDMIDADLDRAVARLRQGGIVVVPSDGLGTGLSELPTRAPRIAKYLDWALEHLDSTKSY
jgi:hypothetical protein